MSFNVILPLPNAIFSGHFKSIYDLGNGRYEHPGADLIYGTPEKTLGAQLVACADMKVTVHRPGDGWGDGSFGVCVVGDHPDTPYWTICAHMEANTVQVNTGDLVKQGTVIGHVGMTGLSTGPHCHWGMSKSDGGAFSPSRYLAADGVNRIGNPLLLDPESFLAEPMSPPPPVYKPGLDDALTSLANLSDIVGQQGISLKNLNDVVGAQNAGMNSRLSAIETALYALRDALPKG